MAETTQPCAWVIERRLNPDALKEYVTRLGIQRGQVIAVTEPQDGQFSLIFEPNAEQQERLAAEAEESDVAETLDTLFGMSVTPAQTPSGAEVETVVAVPVGPVDAPPPAPATVPVPS